MPCYDNIDGALRLTSGLYGNIAGALRTVQTGYDNIDGALRQYHSSSLELYNSGVKDVPISFQSGSYYYSYGGGITCGGWDDGSTIHIYPQYYGGSGYGASPSISAQVDFAVCDWYSRYLCMTLQLESDYGTFQVYAKNAPNGSILKELHFATLSHDEGNNWGSGNSMDWMSGSKYYLYKYDIYGFSAIGLPNKYNRPNDYNNTLKVYTICADLSLMTTRSWSLAIHDKPRGWGTQYSPDYRITRIWQSDEIPAGVHFISTYTLDDDGKISTGNFGMDWFNNAF